MYLPDYVGQVSQVRDSDARLNFRHIFKDNHSSVLLRHTAATICLVTESQITQRSYVVAPVVSRPPGRLFILRGSPFGAGREVAETY